LASLVLELSHYLVSLSLLDKFFLENFGIGGRKEKKATGRKDQARKGKIMKL